jgi:hypothetical protein
VSTCSFKNSKGTSGPPFIETVSIGIIYFSFS